MAGAVAVEVGLDRVEVDCHGDLVVERGESVLCLVPIGPGALAELDVRVADVVDGQPVLEFFDEAALHVSVIGEPLTEDETQWLRALRVLQGQQEPLYFDAAEIDADTLRTCPPERRGAPRSSGQVARRAPGSRR